MKSIKELRERLSERKLSEKPSDYERGYYDATGFATKQVQSLTTHLTNLSPPTFAEGMGTSDTKGVPTEKEEWIREGWEACKEAVLGEVKEGKK